MSEHKQMLPFLTTNPDFARGFEVGMLFTLMEMAVPVLSGNFHVENEDQILLMAHREGYEVEREGVANGRIELSIQRPKVA